jgi:hypothetical protein
MKMIRYARAIVHASRKRAGLYGLAPEIEDAEELRFLSAMS